MRVRYHLYVNTMTIKNSNCMLLHQSSEDIEKESAFLRFIWVGIVLAWIRYFVVEKLSKLVVSSGKKSSEKGPYPVYPMIGWEVTIYHTGTKRSCWINRTSSEVDPLTPVVRAVLFSYCSSNWETNLWVQQRTLPARYPQGQWKLLLSFPLPGIELWVPTRRSETFQWIPLERWKFHDQELFQLPRDQEISPRQERLLLLPQLSGPGREICLEPTAMRHRGPCQMWPKASQSVWVLIAIGKVRTYVYPPPDWIVHHWFDRTSMR